MKRVCIVTFYKSSNFGSGLQALALSTVIEKFGYKTYFLNRIKTPKFMLKHPTMIYARICKRLTKKQSANFFTPVLYQMSTERRKKMNQYTIDNYRELKINNDTEWKKIIKERMPFIAGSDIIWNPAFGYPGYYFLDFACFAKLPCLSYGSSIGSLSLPKKYYNAYRRYLSHFHTIGVRENATIEMFSKITDASFTKVVDPTLLLTSSDWDKFSNKAQYSLDISGRFIFCYFVMNDQRYWDYAKMVQKETGLQIVVLPMHYLDEKQPFTIIKDGTPYEFIDLIKRAEFILTDSFHACSFALQYKKEFYLMRRDRKAEDAKFDELLTRYKLVDRTIKDESRFKRKLEINYEVAYAQLNRDRLESLAFLKQALQHCDGKK